MKVQHKTRPAEPWGKVKQMGDVSFYKDGAAKKYRITPGNKGIPAQAFVNWGDFETWERLSDLDFL